MKRKQDGVKLSTTDFFINLFFPPESFQRVSDYWISSDLSFLTAADPNWLL